MVERDPFALKVDNDEKLAPDALMMRFEEACRWLKSEEGEEAAFEEFVDVLNARFNEPRWLIKEAKRAHMPGATVWEAMFKEKFALSRKESPKSPLVFIKGNDELTSGNYATETIGKETYLLLAFAWESKRVRDILSERAQEPYLAFLESHIQTLGFNLDNEDDVEKYKDLVYGLAAIYFHDELERLDRKSVQDFIASYVGDFAKQHSHLVGAKAVLDAVVSDEYSDIVSGDERLQKWRSYWLEEKSRS